jgi:hypothetical protein
MNFEFNFVNVKDNETDKNNNIIIHNCSKSYPAIRDNTIFYIVKQKHEFDLHILHKYLYFGI